MPTQTYSVRLKGEQHTFPITCWEGIELAPLCDVLSDVTGYLATHIRETIIAGMGSGPKTVYVKTADGWDPKTCVPQFMVIEDVPAERP